MIRFLMVDEGKPIHQCKAGAELKRGAPVVKDADGATVTSATNGLGEFLVDVAPNYDGVNAIVEPTDGMFENIVENQTVLVIPTQPGERYATTEVTVGGLTAGDALVATSGKFAKAGATTNYIWVYRGEYNDPTGKMYIIERVNPAVTAGG